MSPELPPKAHIHLFIYIFYFIFHAHQAFVFSAPGLQFGWPLITLLNWARFLLVVQGPLTGGIEPPTAYGHEQAPCLPITAVVH